MLITYLFAGVLAVLVFLSFAGPLSNTSGRRLR